MGRTVQTNFRGWYVAVVDLRFDVGEGPSNPVAVTPTLSYLSVTKLTTGRPSAKISADVTTELSPTPRTSDLPRTCRHPNTPPSPHVRFLLSPSTIFVQAVHPNWEGEREREMVMVRERRHQQALRLPLPPPPVAVPGITYHFPDSPGSVDRLSDLEKLSVLGHGSSGTVYKVRHLRTSCVFALKVLRFGPSAADARRQAAQEADILTRVDSPFVVRCHGVLERSGEEQLCLVMEYMAGGSLHDVLRARRRLPEELIAGVARRVLEGLRYLHGMGVVHRDIKPSNLLIGSNGEVKIADFGASRVVAAAMGPAGGGDDACAGTCAYMSPERFDSEGFGRGGDGGGFAGDVWALGVVLLECLVGRFPLVEAGERPDWATLVCAICFGGPPAIPDAASPEFRSFLGRCLEKDWRRRGMVGELLSHPFVAKCCCSTEGSVDEAKLLVGETKLSTYG